MLMKGCKMNMQHSHKMKMDTYINPGVYTAITLAAELDRVINAEFSFIRVVNNELNQRMHLIASNAPDNFALDLQ